MANQNDDYQRIGADFESLNSLRPLSNAADWVIAIELYEHERDDEIDIKVADIITVLERRFSKWWYGRNERTGKTGLFPSKIVQTYNPDIISDDNNNQGPERMVETDLQENTDMILYSPASQHSIEEDNTQLAVALRSNQQCVIRVMDSDSDINEQTNRTSRQRFFVIGELIETEENYVKELKFTLQKFSDFVKMSHLLPEKEINEIFEHLQRIYDFNLSFYEILKAQNDSVAECLIGSTLVNYFEQMLPIYKNYCSSNVAELISQIDENEQFSAELEEIATLSNSHQTFKSGLVRPMQRITKYPLMIEKLLDNTISSHPDHEDCQQAFESSKLLCKEIDKIYDQMCLQVEPFKKLRWIQKHVLIPSEQVDQTIDFISETRFLGPRILLHSGMLLHNSKLLFAFLFNDFLLLAKPNEPPLSITEKNNSLFENVDTRHLKCTLHEKPFLLNDLQVADLDEFESSLNSNLFRLEVKSLKKNISLQTNSIEEWIDWVQKINLAKKNYSKTDQMFREIDKGSIRTSQLNPIAIFTLANVEAFQLYSRNYALNAYCKVALGREWAEAFSTTRSDTIRRVMDFRKTIHKQGRRRSILSILKDGIGINNLFSNDKTEDPHRLIWNMNFPFKVNHSDDILFIRCYDANPFAPHQFLGEAKLSISELLQQNLNINQSITKRLNLDMPSEQLTQNFLRKLNISPYLMITFDLTINTDVDSIKRLYNLHQHGS